MYTHARMKKPAGPVWAIFGNYIRSNLLILLLPALVTLVFSGFSVHRVRSDIDSFAAYQLASSMERVDRQYLDFQNVAAQLAIDYEVNFYLNHPGPFSAVDRYNSKRIGERLNSLVLGNDLVSHCFMHFALSGLVASDSGSSDYASFYGPIFQIEGERGEDFLDSRLGSVSGQRIYTALPTVISGQRATSHLAVRSIGYGANTRGTLVAVIDARTVAKLLLGLPEKYGGWVAVYDPEGRLVSTTDSAAEERNGWKDLRAHFFRTLSAATPADAAGPEAGSRSRSPATSLRIGGQTYRGYSARSTLTGWTYVAILPEKNILAETRSLRDTALLLLGLGFLGAGLASALVAYLQAKPLGRLFSLLMGDHVPATESLRGRENLYGTVENAISSLSDSRHQLEEALLEAGKAARRDFWGRLLDGTCGDRAQVYREAARLGIVLPSGGPERSGSESPQFDSGLIHNTSSTVTDSAHSAKSDDVPQTTGAFKNQPRLFVLLSWIEAGIGDEPGANPSLSAEPATDEAILGRGGYGLALSPGRTAFILPEEGDMRAVAARTAGALRAAAMPELREAFVFGAGEPVDDPLLLQLSLAQAETALRRAEAAGTRGIAFHADLPAPESGFHYPLDIEASLMKAIRSGSRELFESLFESLVRDNFGTRMLAAQEARDLGAALRCTAIRLLPDYPQDGELLREKLYRSPEVHAGSSALDGIREVFRDMLSAAEASKRSHNSHLAARARDFILANYADPELGLALVARRLDISENYLSTLYKEQQGEGISQTIEMTRMDAAKALLRGTQLSVDVIAGRTGYRLQNFRRAFKRVTGLAPSDYRKTSAERSGTGSRAQEGRIPPDSDQNEGADDAAR